MSHGSSRLSVMLAQVDFCRLTWAACCLANNCLDARERHPPAGNHHIAGVKASDFNFNEHPRSDADASLLLVKLLFRWRHIGYHVLYLELARASRVFALWPFSGVGELVYKDDDRELLVVGHRFLPFGPRGWIRAPSLIQRQSGVLREPRAQRRRCEP